MQKFTPGPWVVETHHRMAADRVFAVWYVKGATEKGGSVGVAVQPAFSTDEHGEANARLISAAPELYEALREIAGLVRDALGCTHIAAPSALALHNAQVKADVALAKATGA